jgi:hypothetical protein
VPQDSQFHREGEARRRHRVFIGLENINPDNLIGAKKRQNKITEYRQMLLAWKRKHHDLCRLHPRLPERHAGVDQARHRDHQARAAGRHARVLHPDAAAGLRGPQGLDEKGRLDGPRHEQIRLEHVMPEAEPEEKDLAKASSQKQAAAAAA